MNKYILVIFLLALSLNANAFDNLDSGKGDKAALLMVHFGTTFDDTREKTIDAINQMAVNQFSNMKVVEAYTSRIIISRLAKRGIEKLTPRQALLRLAAEGYTHVFIQSTNIIDGIESEALRVEADYMVPFFKEVRIGRPLLYSVQDCQEVTEILASRYDAHPADKRALVFIGHGTHTPANAIYSQIDYMFKADGHPDCYVSTVEGYPSFDTTSDLLLKNKVKEVTLIPFMFVAGDHAKNDIDGEWREQLTANGLKVNTILEGLGQIPEIRSIFIRHIHDGLKEKPLSPVERKAAFLQENL
ncbi:MAG: sirohydrochlorin cobaltochelatase [Muribaculaceae bacterium]|nr:sirohydrochlorin cobaltochelatase [Muribaculaceae bacterium]